MDYDDMMAEQKRQVDAYEMAVTQRRIEVKQFIEELTDEQALVFGKILADCNVPGNLSMLQGVLQGNLMYGRGMSWMGMSLDNEVKTFIEARLPDIHTSQATHQNDTPLTRVAQLEIDHANAEKWGLEWNEDPNYPDEYRCKGCKTPVHSLEDRMLREPGVEGCPTCQSKAKWGG